MSNNSWEEWSRHVLAELVRLNDAMEENRKEIAKLHTRLTVIETKAVTIASVIGILFTIVNTIIKFIH